MAAASDQRAIAGVLLLVPPALAPMIKDNCAKVIEERQRGAAEARRALAWWCERENLLAPDLYTNGRERWRRYQSWKISPENRKHARALQRACFVDVLAPRVGSSRTNNLTGARHAVHAYSMTEYAQTLGEDYEQRAHSLSMASFCMLTPPPPAVLGYSRLPGTMVGVSRVLCDALASAVPAKYDDDHVIVGVEVLTLSSYLSGYPRSEYGGFPHGVSLPLGSRPQGTTPINYGALARGVLDDEAGVLLTREQLQDWIIAAHTPNTTNKNSRVYVLRVPETARLVPGADSLRFETEL